MLLEKYKPQAISGMIANSRSASGLKSFIAEWKQGAGVAALAGPPGCGKSLALELVAAELGCELVEGMIEDVSSASAEQSLIRRGKILALDLGEPSGLKTEKELDAIEALAAKARWPLVLVANDAYEEKLRLLHRRFPYLRVINFYPARAADLARFLEYVCRSENRRCDFQALFTLAQKCDGDVRFALLCLESLPEFTQRSVDSIIRDGMYNIYQTLDRLFARQGLPDGIDENILRVVAENAHEVYSGSELLFAYSCIALAERLSRRSAFGFHALSLLPARQRVWGRRYSFPRRRASEIPQELAQRLHCSRRKAVAYTQILEKLGMLSCRNVRCAHG